MTRLPVLSLAIVLLVLASLRLNAEDAASLPPVSTDAAPAPNEAADKKMPETPAERTELVVEGGKVGSSISDDSSVAPVQPQEAAMDREARQLAAKFRSAKLDEQPALRKQLEELTERHFEQRQQRRQREMEDLSQRLDKLRATHQRRQDNKAAVVRQRIEDLLDPNADLRWDEPGTSSPRTDSLGAATNPAGGQTSPTPANAKPSAPASNALNEPTYDGTTYSHWLQMLETERKPEKLRAAMEACSRLTSKEDAPRVFRGVIAGWEQFRDSTDQQELRNVSTVARWAVQRMLVERGSDVSDAAAEELNALVNDSQKLEATGSFVELLLSGLHGSNKPVSSIQSRTPQYIAALVRQSAKSEKVEGKLGALAIGFWILSEKPVAEFEGLRPLVLRELDYELEDHLGMSWWHEVATPEGYVQIPEIVPLIMKHFGKFSHKLMLVRRLGDLGPAAEPAVPQLVEYFVDTWNAQESNLREYAAGKTQMPGENQQYEQMSETLEALRAIGPGARHAISLLRELTSIEPPHRKKFDPENNFVDRFWDHLDKARLVIDKNPDEALPESKRLLSDFSHLQIVWNLKTIRPSASVEQISLHVGDSFHFRPRRHASTDQVHTLMHLMNMPTSAPNYKIDETTSPKQITFLPSGYPGDGNSDYEQFGIYGLNGDRLKIEFAKPGKPRPTAFSPDPEKLPAGRILLVFERDRGEPEAEAADAAATENGAAVGNVSTIMVAPAVPVTVEASPDEPTFDGTPYSQWLKMLETERKPEKLAAAMEACSRLAVKGDVVDIARGILKATDLYEGADADEERNTVWASGEAALRRLLSRELGEEKNDFIHLLRAWAWDPDDKTTSKFLCGFFVGNGTATDKKFNQTLQPHLPDLIERFVEADAAGKPFDLKTAEAATMLWILSGKPIADIEGLKPLVLKGYEFQLMRGEQKEYRTIWETLPTLKNAAEVSEIVPLLVKHFDKDPQYAIHFLGELGPLAEPAVPKLVEVLLETWKLHEGGHREYASGKSDHWEKTKRGTYSQMASLLKILENIGPRAVLAVPLVRELNSLIPRWEKQFDNEPTRFWDQVAKTRLAIDMNPDEDTSKLKPLLSEFSHFATTWNLVKVRPGPPIADVRLDARFLFELEEPKENRWKGVRSLMDLAGIASSRPNFTIDESTTPKQITLREKDVKSYRQFGIFERNGDRLKIEFAKPGKPCPTEFSPDATKLADDHVLLEFERDRSIAEE